MLEYLVFITLVFSSTFFAEEINPAKGEYYLHAYNETCFYADATPWPINYNVKTYWSTANGNCNPDNTVNVLINVQDDMVDSFCKFKFTTYDMWGRILKERLINIKDCGDLVVENR